jgi:cysteine desulfurase
MLVNIYLDNNSTTKIDPLVLKKMMPYLTDTFGNASSNHVMGSNALNGVNNARKQVAGLIGASENEIIFTSGATEAINLALKSVVLNSKHKTPHIITLATEHPAVLDTCFFLQTAGVEITLLPVQKNGLIEIDVLKNAIRENTVLVCVMHVNNETGVIQPIKEISSIAHEKNILFMTDATQSFGKIEIDVNALGIDILCFSGHKFHGPKGVGGLYFRSKRPFKVKISAQLHGGGHESGMRSGTLNVSGIVGIGAAAEIAKKEMKANKNKIETLRNLFEKELLKVNGSFVNGDIQNRIFNTSNICIPGVDADAILAGLKNICISNGSACSSDSIFPSHVLTAMGLSEADSYSSVRISFCKFNTENETNEALNKIMTVVKELNQLKK